MLGGANSAFFRWRVPIVPGVVCMRDSIIFVFRTYISLFRVAMYLVIVYWVAHAVGVRVRPSGEERRRCGG